MNRLCAIACTLCSLWAVEGLAGPAVAVLDASPASDARFARVDEETRRSLQQSLAKEGGFAIVGSDRLAAFLAEPPDPQAGPLAEQAREHLAAGRAFSTRLKPKQAITEFKAALRNLRAVFPHLPGLSALEEAHLELGMTYQALGDEAASVREYRMVLLLDPGRSLDEALVNPVVMDRFEKVRADLVTSMKGSVSLLSTPAGAEVSMDGRPVGRTPITIPGVLPGEHYFSMASPGYKTWFGVLEVPPGAMARQEVFLAEGLRIGRLRLLRAAGAGRADAARQLAAGLGADLLVLLSFSHPGDQSLLKLSAWRPNGPIATLGVFSTEAGRLAAIHPKLVRWLNGDRQAFAVIAPPGDTPPPDPPPLDPPPQVSSFYERWWFWTLVGVAVAGAAAATTTALMLDGDRGIRVDVYR